jgi:hypothetical protein
VTGLCPVTAERGLVDFGVPVPRHLWLSLSTQVLTLPAFPGNKPVALCVYSSMIIYFSGSKLGREGGSYCNVGSKK